jgi:hypothetical protein
MCKMPYMAIIEYDISTEQGSSLSRVVTYSDANSSPINLTGYTARMQVRPRASSGYAYLTLTSPSGGLTLGGTTGTITILVDGSVTSAIPAGDYVYDLEVVNGAYVDKVMGGDFTLSAEVTR